MVNCPKSASKNVTDIFLAKTSSYCFYCLRCGTDCTWCRLYTGEQLSSMCHKTWKNSNQKVKI